MMLQTFQPTSKAKGTNPCTGQKNILLEYDSRDTDDSENANAPHIVPRKSKTTALYIAPAATGWPAREGFPYYILAPRLAELRLCSVINSAHNKNRNLKNQGREMT